MKIRHDAVFISSVLFTVAFLLLVPQNWDNARNGLPFWHIWRAAQADKVLLAHMELATRELSILLGQCGVASLVLILVVLIIIWKGYVKGLQWTWFIMFVIVVTWYFPLFLLPSLRNVRGSDDLIMWVSSWWVLNFLLMLTALLLPIRSFFRRQDKA